MSKQLKLLYLRYCIARAQDIALEKAVHEAVRVRSYRLNFAGEFFLYPRTGEPAGTLYLPPMEGGLVDAGPLWDFVRNTHGKTVRRYLALKKLAERIRDAA